MDVKLSSGVPPMLLGLLLNWRLVLLLNFAEMHYTRIACQVELWLYDILSWSRAVLSCYMYLFRTNSMLMISVSMFSFFVEL